MKVTINFRHWPVDNSINFRDLAAVLIGPDADTGRIFVRVNDPRSPSNGRKVWVYEDEISYTGACIMSEEKT